MATSQGWLRGDDTYNVDFTGNIFSIQAYLRYRYDLAIVVGTVDDVENNDSPPYVG
jgi:hypothetical protein